MFLADQMPGKSILHHATTVQEKLITACDAALVVLAVKYYIDSPTSCRIAWLL